MNGQTKKKKKKEEEEKISLCLVLLIQESAVSRTCLVTDEIKAMKYFTICSSLKCQEKIILKN